MAETELKTITGQQSNVKRVLVPAAPLNRDHALIALLWFGVAIAAAVGLGQGDWYTRENTDYFGNYVTFYYGLTARVKCSGPVPSAALPAGSTQTPIAGWPFGCNQRVTYQSISLADITPEEQTAAAHLIGAGDIIIVVLSFGIIAGAIAGFINANYAYDYEVDADVKARHLRGAQILGFIALITEILAIIFWITIFPYAYARDVELNLPGVGQGQDPLINNPGFNSNLTLGVGFAIQIAGFFASIFALLISNFGFLQPTSTLPPANRA